MSILFVSLFPSPPSVTCDAAATCQHHMKPIIPGILHDENNAVLFLLVGVGGGRGGLRKRLQCDPTGHVDVSGYLLSFHSFFSLNNLTVRSALAVTD